ncbi:MAG: ABC transporter permease [Roseovarius sp. BRH_c41]|jgi:glycine betaine/proline transport system permease protein|uniref:ABC transporter permease n=1 Tax=Roseovarius sp. BRH_c41 TaxID=1629709 RepID=UPI0005F233C6|nr:ABC transporter permease subunit [Roseovarius sp. BRH_c41]KJS43085.1 MAG: ABC transporter permease [Roseovarius sp. BRH_c41]
MTIENSFSPGQAIAPVFRWLNINFHAAFEAFSDAINAALVLVETPLISGPPIIVITILSVAACLLTSWRTAVLVAVGFTTCFLAGLWKETMETTALVAVAVLVALAIGIPLGILASRQRRIELGLRPILDVMQTLPPWVYLVPAVILFGLGRVPAVIATVIYGTPPILRITTLAIKGVPRDRIELGRAFGASDRMILWKIELPSALPTILVGINQCIILSLAMVVLAGLVGAGGLGAEVTRGLTRMEMGLGLRAGLAVVILALILDRFSRATLTARRTRPLTGIANALRGRRKNK